ncbi:MAG: PQQ-binding-like beta-propeller repeat protein [Planctomyces sp.]|nr:PQQ-binding-like beta-propeller repeat protein [Planctomyces sp.]
MLRLAGVLALFAGSVALAGDWRSFRGVETASIADAPLPLSWSDDSNVAWTADLPGRGLSSPIVVQGRVIVTCSSGGRQERLHALCFDAKTGRQLWERQFWATGRTSGHPKTCNAAPTPASDGERIFAFYSSNDMACLDLDGNLLWFRGLTYDYPNASNSLGMSSSPVVSGDTIVVMVENDADSFTAGLDVRTGEERWHLQRPRMANWTSPALWRQPDSQEELVLIQSGEGVSAMEARSGEVRWTYDDGASTIPSTSVVEGIAYVPSHGVTAIRPGKSTPNVAEIVWQEGSLNPGTGSVLAHRGKVYVVNDGGVLSCADAATGKREWQSRLEGPFSGSAIIAGDHLYVFNENGVGFVVNLANRGEIVSQHSFEDTILCTPAAADGALYVRSDARLWKIAAGQ